MKNTDYLTPRERAALARNPNSRLAQPRGDGSQVGVKLAGVGGWLALLVAVLIVVSPVLSATMIFAQQQEARGLYPEGVDSELWGSILLLDWSMFGLQALLGIFAGILLLKRFQRSTVWMVIGLIWLSSVGVGVLSLGLGESFIPGSATAAEVGGSLVRPIGFSTIWSLYLVLSRRVKNTYPKTHSS